MRSFRVKSGQTFTPLRADVAHGSAVLAGVFVAFVPTHSTTGAFNRRARIISGLRLASQVPISMQRRLGCCTMELCD